MLIITLIDVAMNLGLAVKVYRAGKRTLASQSCKRIWTIEMHMKLLQLQRKENVKHEVLAQVWLVSIHH